MSQQDLNDFADWLVANPDKKGSPQYDTIAKAFRELDEQYNPVDRSFSSAFQSGIDAPLENMATTARMLGFEGTADTLSGLTDAPVNYESAADRFTNPQKGDPTIAGYAYEQLPRAVVEQLGQYGGALATRAGGGLVGGALTGGNPIGVAGGAAAGPFLFEFVQQLGPAAQKRAANNGRTEPNWEDWSAAAATAGVSGTLNSLGVKGFSGSSLLNRTLKEGATEGGQALTEQVGTSAGTEAGLQVDPKQALGEAIIGGTTAGTTSIAGDTAAATGRGVKNVTDRVFNPADGTPTDPEAAAELAQRLAGIAEANSYDLNDIDKMSTKGARETVDKAHVQLAEELKQVAKDLKDRLQITDADELSTVIEKVMAQAGQREARNKTKNTVGVQETQAIESLTGDTVEGQRMLKIIRQLNELTELHNSGYQGGLSRITDQFSPLGSSVGYDRGAVATERLLRPIVSGGAALQTGGASLLGQAAIAGAGRAVDALTGRRSRVRRFIEQNRSNQGIVEPQGLRSLRGDKQAQQLADEQAAAAEEARLKALALEATRLNDPPKGDPNDLQNASPQFLMEYASGLNRRGVADALDVIRRINPKLRKAADSYQKMMEEGTRVKDLTPLIRRVRGLKKRRPDLFNDTSTGTTPSEAIQAKVEESANYQRGIQSNLEFVKNQKKKIDNDKSMNAFDKSVAKDALDKLSLNLGSEPADTAVAILNQAIIKARNKDKIREYVAPYVDRVARQQRNAKKPEAVEQVSSDQKPFTPIFSEELMGRPLDEQEIAFNEEEKSIYDLRNQLEQLQMRAGEGMLKSRDPSSPIGTMNLDFDHKKVAEYRQKVNIDGTAALDPEGRFTISMLQSGLEGKGGVTNEQLAYLIPSIVRSLEFISGADGEARGAYGQYRETFINDKFKRNKIEVADLGEKLGKQSMSPEQFLDTLLHETGHAIGARSLLDQMMRDLQKVIKAEGSEAHIKLMDQAIKVSQLQRPQLWESLDQTLENLHGKTGYYFGPARFAYQLNVDRQGGIDQLTHDVQQRAMSNGQMQIYDRLQFIVPSVAKQIKYLNNPRELVADAVALYLKNPQKMKSQFPELAKFIRDGVNESAVAEYITFHSLAGLLGVTGMLAVLQSALTGGQEDDERGILSLGRGALSA